MRRRRRRWRPRSQLHAHRPHRVLLPSEERDATTGGACRLGARAAARALRHQPQPRARRARELLARVAAVGLRPQRWRGEPVHQRLQPCATEAATLCIRGCVAPPCTYRDLVRPLPPGSQGQGAPPAALRRGYGALRVPDAAPTLPARPLARRTARHAPRLQRCAAAATPPPQAATPRAQAATPRAQACAATSCCSAGLTWSTVRPCSTSSRALQPLTRRAHTWGCSLWHAGLQPLTNRAAASSTHGVLGVKPRVPRADTPARVHMLMRAWAAWSVLHVKTHRYVPSADTPTSAVRVPPWLVAGGEAAPPPRQVTITAEASSVSSAAPPTTTAASTTC